MTKKHAKHLLKQLIIKHGQVRHNEALEVLYGKDKSYTVIGFYGDNQQPWMAFVEAGSPKTAAKKGIETVYANGESGAELEDMFVVEVVEGQCRGELGNQKVSGLKDLK